MRWVPRLLERAFWFPYVWRWGSGVESNQSRVTQHLRVQGLLRDQSRVTQAAMWWHSLVCSLSLLCRFCVPLVVYLLLDMFIVVITFIKDDWKFMDDVLLTCGFWLEMIIFRWLYLMILVFGLYLVRVWCLGMWSWYWIECSYFWIILSSWVACVTFEVVLAIRGTLPRNILCLFYRMWIVHYLPCRVGVEAWLGNHAVER